MERRHLKNVQKILPLYFPAIVQPRRERRSKDGESGRKKRMVGSEKWGGEKTPQCFTLEMIDRDGAANLCSWPEQQSADSVLQSWDSKRCRDERKENKKDTLQQKRKEPADFDWRAQKKRRREIRPPHRRAPTLHSVHRALEGSDLKKETVRVEGAGGAGRGIQFN